MKWETSAATRAILRQAQDKFFAAVMGLAVAAACVSVASAHATLLRTDPAENAVLAQPPSEVNLWFSEPISPRFSAFRVLDIDGRVIKLTGIERDPADRTHVSLTLPKLTPGLYSVIWKVLSDTDGHFTQSNFVFGVGNGVGNGVGDAAQLANVDSIRQRPNAEGPADADSFRSIGSVSPVEAALRALNFISLAGLAGAIIAVYLVLMPAQRRLSEQGSALGAPLQSAQGRALAWAAWCGGLSLLMGIGLFVQRLAVLNEASLEDTPGWYVLFQTQWGAFWLIREGSVAALTILVLVLRRAYRRRYALLAGLLLVVVAVAQALSGHAAAVAPDPALAVAADAVHFLAASAWVGGLMALIVGLLPLVWQHKSNWADLLRAGWRPFSRVAAISTGLLVATGLYSSARQVASVDALINTLYGQTLLVKVGLVLVIGVVGLLNSIALHRRPQLLTQLPKLVVVEAGFGVLALSAAGLLTASVPANGLEFKASPTTPGLLSQTVDDMLVTLSVKPNRPGPNVLTIVAASTRRPAPAEVLRVIVRFTALNRDMGVVSAVAEKVDRDTYRLGGNYLSLPGEWQIDVVVRRKGLEDSVARFNWTMSSPTAKRPVLISNQPIEQPLMLAAAALLCLMAVVIAVRRVRGMPKTKS